MMILDKICDLVEEAHEIFSATSVIEVINLDKPSAQEVLNKAYGNPGTENIDRYIDVIERLKKVTQ